MHYYALLEYRAFRNVVDFAFLLFVCVCKYERSLRLYYSRSNNSVVVLVLE